MKAMKRQLKFIENKSALSDGRVGKHERELPRFSCGVGTLLTLLGVAHSWFWVVSWNFGDTPFLTLFCPYRNDVVSGA